MNLSSHQSKVGVVRARWHVPAERSFGLLMQGILASAAVVNPPTDIRPAVVHFPTHLPPLALRFVHC